MRVLRRGTKGPEVRYLQNADNEKLDQYELDWEKDRADGVFGKKTGHNTQLVMFAMGFSRRHRRRLRQTDEHRGWISIRDQKIIRGLRRRTLAMRRRSRSDRVRNHLQNLHQEHRKAVAEAKDDELVVTFDGKPCAGWIAREILEPARMSGTWDGYLISGYRTPAYSTSLCYGICGAPSCPGLCAGASSNHSGNVKPAGAVDVSDAGGLIAYTRSKGIPFHGAGEMLPHDFNHCSASGV
jgi:hypothetical protein